LGAAMEAGRGEKRSATGRAAEKKGVMPITFLIGVVGAGLVSARAGVDDPSPGFEWRLVLRARLARRAAPTFLDAL
jgi:hypothetical protein